MTQLPGASLNSSPQLVDGVDVDAIARAVKACVGVDDLDGGPFDTVAAYLPGRRVPGVRVNSDGVTVQVRSRWGVPIPQVGQQVRTAVGALVAGRKLSIVVSDIADPPELQSAPADPPVPSESEVVWTSSSDSPNVGPSSVSTIQTEAETTTSSLPASLPLTPRSMPPA